MLGRWNCAADGGYAARWHSTRSVDQLVRSRIGIAARGQAGRSAPSLPAGSPECAQRRAHSRLKPLGRGISGRSVGSPAAARMLRMSSTVNGVDRFFWMTIVPSW